MEKFIEDENMEELNTDLDNNILDQKCTYKKNDKWTFPRIEEIMKQPNKHIFYGS